MLEDEKKEIEPIFTVTFCHAKTWHSPKIFMNFENIGTENYAYKLDILQKSLLTLKIFLVWFFGTNVPHVYYKKIEAI